MDPERLVGLTDNPELKSIAGEVRDRFERFLDDGADEIGTKSKP